MAGQRVGRQRERQGVVVSDGVEKTIVVKVTSVKPHAEYGKVIRRSTRLQAHDEENQAHVGDTVLVRECRPLSKHKTWRLIEVLERAE